MWQNGENLVHPPFQSARIWIKNSKIDVDFLKMNKPLFSTSYGGAQFIRLLWFCKGNNFFIDKKFNSLLLPVINIAVQLIRVYPSSKL